MVILFGVAELSILPSPFVSIWRIKLGFEEDIFKNAVVELVICMFWNSTITVVEVFGLKLLIVRLNAPTPVEFIIKTIGCEVIITKASCPPSEGA